MKYTALILIIGALLASSAGCLVEAARREREIYDNLPEATYDPETGEWTPGVI